MTTPASGIISLTDVLNELRISNPGRGTTISLGDADVLGLAGLGSLPCSLGNLYNKSSYTPMTANGVNDSASGSSISSGGSVVCHPSVTVSGGSGGYGFAWSFTSNPNGCSISATGAQTCNVSHSFALHAAGTANATLQCVITDNTAHSITVTGITAALDWSNA